MEPTAGAPVEIEKWRILSASLLHTEGKPMNTESLTKTPMNMTDNVPTDTQPNPEWLAFLRTRGARENGAQIADFGQPELADLTAARHGTLLVPLTHLALLDCTDEDAQSFLQNLTTNDAAHLPADGAQYSAWCSPQGRMLASFILYRQGTGFRALLAADLCTATLTGLRKYILRAKVRLNALSGSHVLLGLAGTQTEAALHAADLALPDRPMTTIAGTTATVIRLGDIDGTNSAHGSHNAADAKWPRCIIAAETTAAPALFDALAGSARPAGISAWQRLDVQTGEAWITAATRDAFVPQMLAFDKIDGVSFNKGCYPGQEIIARAHYLGKVKRSLYRLHSETPLSAGEAIYPTDSLEACGTVVQAAPDGQGRSGYIALAVIKDSVAQAAQSAAASLTTAAGKLIDVVETVVDESVSA